MVDLFLDAAVSQGYLTPQQAEEVRRAGGSSRDVAVSRGYLDETEARRVEEIVRKSTGVFAGRYELLGKLGQGGMGVVYKARDTRLDRIVALKGIPPGNASDVARFEREARMAAKLSHPNIVPVYDVEIVGDQCYLTMEYVEGRSLAEVRPPLREAVERVLEVAEGLQFAHDQGVIHRDVKPENILVDAKGRARLTDFGLAKPVSGPRITVSGVVVGTPSYMSPEQARGLAVDARSDVYSLGATLYQMLSGRPPFDGAGSFEVVQQVLAEPPPPLAGVARDLGTIVMKCLEKEPARRYGTVREMADDLRRFQNGEPIRARPPSLGYRVRRIFLRRKTVFVTAASALVAGILLVLGALLPELRERESQLAVRLDLKPLEDAVRDARPFLYIYGLENLRAKLERVREALEGLEKIAARPDMEGSAPLWTSIGMARHFLGDDTGAEEALRKAEQLNPDDGWTQFTLGRVHLERSLLPVFTGHADFHAGKQKAEEQARRAVEHLTRPSGRWEGATDLDRHLAETYLAYAKSEREKMRRMCREGLARFGDSVGTEEYRLLLGSSSNGREALTELDEALRRRPHYPLASLFRSLVRERLGDLPGALSDISAAIEFLPRFADAHNNRGVLLWAKADLSGALASFDEALRLDPGLLAAYVNRGNVRRMLTDFDGAERDLRKAQELEPDHVQTFAALSALHLARDQFPEALRLAEEALKREPATPMGLMARGATRAALGDLEGAEKDLVAVLATLPEHRRPPVLLELTEVRTRKGDHAGALRDIGEALRIWPDRTQLLHARGAALLYAGRYDEARNDLDTVLEREPRHAQALHNRGNLLRLQGRWEEALDDLDEAIRIEPSKPNKYLDRAAVRRQLKDLEGALADYAVVFRLRPEDALAHYGKGLIHLDRKEDEEGIREFTRAIESNPKLAEAYVNRGALRGRNGDPEGNREDFEKALEVAAPNWPYRGQVEEALEEMSQRP